MVRIFNQSKINLNLSTASEKEVRQIKGRNFEVPGCGGFLLTEYVPGLEDYYVLGKEVACYDGVEDLVGKIKYYLENENERQSIAQAGYERTLRDHTYEKRLSQVFGRVGLNRDSPL
jgi:spore maturation protein CgeB